jgi:hypothetical protein
MSEDAMQSFGQIWTSQRIKEERSLSLRKEEK